MACSHNLGLGEAPGNNNHTFPALSRVDFMVGFRRASPVFSKGLRGSALHLKIDKFKKYGVRAPVIATIRLAQKIALTQRFRKLRLLISCRAKIGKGVTIGKDVEMTAGAGIVIADNVTIGDRCVFEVNTGLELGLEIGRDTWLSHDTHILANSSIKIGCDVLVGEFTSIRDMGHVISRHNKSIRESGDVKGAILIEDNVWIGRGSGIFANGRSLVISYGTVIAANSVVTRSTEQDVLIVPSIAKRKISRFEWGGI